MTVFTLTEIAKTQVKAGKVFKDEETYTYTGKSATGAELKLKFHAHPTRAWNWVIVEANDAVRPFINKVINEFCTVGGTDFHNSIKSLTVK